METTINTKFFKYPTHVNSQADVYFYILLHMYHSPICFLLVLLTQAGRCLRWSLSRRTGRSLLLADGPRSSLSSLGPPGEGCGCWRLGWPLRQRSRRCWRFHGSLWGAWCCPSLHVGRRNGCARRVFCSASWWPARCTCRQRETKRPLRCYGRLLQWLSADEFMSF